MKGISIREELQKEGRVLLPIRGVSMWPMLRQNTDCVVVERASFEELAPMDVVLYQRPGQSGYTLHRLLRKEGMYGIILGDHCVRRERVPAAWILGRLTSFYRGEKEIQPENILYRLYLFLWVRPQHFRTLVLRTGQGLRRRGGRMYRRLTGKNQKEKEKTTSKSSLLWIRKVTGADWKKVMLILCLETVQALGSLTLAMTLRSFINGIVAKDGDSFRKNAGILLILLLVMIALSSLIRFLKEYTATGILKKFQTRELQEILQKSYGEVTEKHSGEWMNRIESDAAVVASGVTGILPNVFSMGVRLMGGLYLLVRLIPEIAWLILPGGCMLTFFTFLLRGKLKEMHREQQEARGVFRIFLQDRLQNLLVVHSFSREQEVLKEGDEKQELYRRKHIRRDNFSNICNVGFAILMDGAYILGICYCGYRMLQGSMSYGTMIAVMNLVGQVQGPFANLSGYVPQYYAMLASAERLREVERFQDAFREPPVGQEKITAFYQNRMTGIEVREVDFSYGESPVLQKVHLTLPKGSITALTGPSGCGKSTLLKILMGLYPVSSGTCVLTTREGEVPLDSRWRGLFAYVPQGNQLMAGTIREIVTFGRQEKYQDEAGIWRALRAADAESFVRELPGQLDEMLGEQGSGLSEGQVQRLAIARAVYAGHPVLLLDESTSSLDEETEQRVLRNIRALTDCTVVLVTHRRAPLGICDQQMDFGRKTEGDGQA